MFSFQRSFENSLRSGADFCRGSPERRSLNQHTNCKGKAHGSGNYEKTQKGCEKNHDPKKKHPSVSSEFSDTDESKISKDEVDDDGLWVSEKNSKNLLNGETRENGENDKPKKSDFKLKGRLSAVLKQAKERLKPVGEDLKNDREKNLSARKISSARFNPDDRYAYVMPRVGSFRRKKKHRPEISFEELFNIAMHSKNNKDNLKDLEELLGKNEVRRRKST